MVTLMLNKWWRYALDDTKHVFLTTNWDNKYNKGNLKYKPIKSKWNANDGKYENNFRQDKPILASLDGEFQQSIPYLF